MHDKNNSQPSAEAIQSSFAMWNLFVFATKIGGAIIAAVLVIMALFLV